MYMEKKVYRSLCFFILFLGLLYNCNEPSRATNKCYKLSHCKNAIINCLATFKIISNTQPEICYGMEIACRNYCNSHPCYEGRYNRTPTNSCGTHGFKIFFGALDNAAQNNP